MKSMGTIKVNALLAGDIERMLGSANKCPIGLPVNKGGVASSLDHSCVVCSVSCGFHDRYKPPEKQDDTVFGIYVVSSGISMWTYGRLFHDYGKPVAGAVTDPGNNFFGIYFLRNPETNEEYEVDVVSDLHDEYLDRNCPKCGVIVDRYALNGNLCPNCRHMFLQANYGN